MISEAQLATGWHQSHGFLSFLPLSFHEPSVLHSPPSELQLSTREFLKTHLVHEQLAADLILVLVHFSKGWKAL